MQFGQCLPRHLEAISEQAPHFDDVPFRARSRFTQSKDFLVKIAFEGFVLMLLNMNRAGATGKFFKHGDGIAVARETIAHIHLHVHFRDSFAEKDLPGKSSMDFGEVEWMRMITDRQAKFFAFAFSFVQ